VRRGTRAQNGRRLQCRGRGHPQSAYSDQHDEVVSPSHFVTRIVSEKEDDRDIVETFYTENHGRGREGHRRD